MWQQWRVDVIDTRRKLGLPVVDFHPYTKPPGSRPPAMTGVPKKDRVLSIVDTAWASRPGTERTREDFFLDWSQSASRQAWGRVVTLCSSTHIYSFKHDRTLTGTELMLVMGVPITEIESRDGVVLTNSEKHKRLSEAFFGGSIASMLMGIVYNADAVWWK